MVRLLAVLLLTAPVLAASAGCSNVRTEHPPLDRLHADVEVFTDEHGIPHIYAANLHDAMYMQGYVTARDRLFQMEWMRRAAAGRLSEILGKGERETDIFVRAWNLIGRAEAWAAEAEQVDPAAWEAILAYTEGVNQFIADAETGARGAKLSPMWGALGIRPEPVRPAEILAVDRLITFQAAPGTLIELMLELLRQLLGQTFEDLVSVNPPAHVSIVPGFIDNLDRTYRPATAVRDFTAPAPTLEFRSEALRRLGELIPRMQSLNGKMIGGSNAWTVNRDRTASGAPLLANDTHQGLGNPPVYYQVHVNAGAAYHATGLNFPGGPGVQIGHNEDVAWGATTNRADDADLFLEVVTDLDGQKAVRFNGEKVPLVERVEVWKWREPDGTSGEETITYQEVPHHGPVFPLEPLLGDSLSGIGNAILVSMRWTGLEGGFKGSGIRAFFRLSRSTDANSAEESFTDYTGGAFNIHYATRDGDTGYHARKMLPIRGCSNRPYLMLPGDGSCEWVGTVPLDAIPHARNPERGFIVSANNDSGGGTLVGSPEDKNVYIGAIYDVGFRAQRIDDELTRLVARGGVNPEDMMTLQADTHSLVAARLIPYFKAALAEAPGRFTGETLAAAQAMAGWNFTTAGDSTVAHLFHAWLGRVLQATFGDELSAKTDFSLVALDEIDGSKAQIFVRPLLKFLDDTQDTIHVIEAGQAEFPSASGHNYFDDINTAPLESRDQILLDAFAWAFAQTNQAAANMGYAASWRERRWDQFHVVRLDNPADFAVPAMILGPYGIDGGLWTVDVADFTLLRGGAVPDRYFVGNTPSNRTIHHVRPDGFEMWHGIPGGQSEHPESPYFGGWAENFYKNLYHKMPFTKAEVEALGVKPEVFKAGFGNIAE